MAHTLPARPLSREVRLQDSVRPRMAKADVGVSEGVRTPDEDGLGLRCWNALERHHGSVKAIGLALGADPSQVRREVLRLNFAQFRDRLEDLAVLNAEIQAVCAPLLDSKAYVRERIRATRRALDEIEQGIELIA